MSMRWKVSYEACVENILEYEDGDADIVALDHSEINEVDRLYSMMDLQTFWFCIKRWQVNDWDGGYDYHYLGKDGTFTPTLPKYVMKKLQPHVDHIINHKNFKT